VFRFYIEIIGGSSSTCSNSASISEIHFFAPLQILGDSNFDSSCIYTSFSSDEVKEDEQDSDELNSS